MVAILLFIIIIPVTSWVVNVTVILNSKLKGVLSVAHTCTVSSYSATLSTSGTDTRTAA